MKNLLLSTLVLCSVVSAKAIEFENAVTAGNPVTITLVKITQFGSGLFWLFDDSNIRRLVISRSSTNYEILNSKSISLSTRFNTNEDQAKLISLAQNVSSSCPMEVQVDRASLSIIKVSLKCDPLALGPLEQNAG